MRSSTAKLKNALSAQIGGELAKKGPEAFCQGEVAGKEMSKSGLPGGVSRFTSFWPASLEQFPGGRCPGREDAAAAAAAVYGASRQVFFHLL